MLNFWNISLLLLLAASAFAISLIPVAYGQTAATTATFSCSVSDL